MKSPEVAVIHPDGCRDIILISRPGEPDEVLLTGLDHRPRLSHFGVETKFVGYRLCPGSSVASRASAIEVSDPATLEDMIESEATNDRDMSDMIEALTQPRATIAGVARQNGTTTRTLQRRFHQLSLPTPDFWRLLGRARRAIQALHHCVPLADVADAYGYSDQSHMTREFVRWFGFSPMHLRRNKSLLADICQPGLGNWQNDDRLEIDNLL